MIWMPTSDRINRMDKINSEHSVHSVKIRTADDADLREYDSIKHRGHGARRGPTTNPAAAGRMSNDEGMRNTNSTNGTNFIGVDSC